MSARDDDIDLEEAVEALSETVEQNNREVEQSLEQIYGDLEDHEDQILDLARFARHNRDRIVENYENIDDLWLEIDEIWGGIEEVEGDSTYFDIDFTGIEKTVKYIGNGLKNLFIPPAEKTGEKIDENRRKVLLGAGALITADYINIVPGDEHAGDGYFRGGECGWDFDAYGIHGEQRKCPSQDNGDGDGGVPPGDGQPTETDRQPTETDRQPTETDRQPTETDRQPTETDRQPTETDTVDNVQTPYEKDVELSDEDLQYAINNTSGTDEILINIENVEGTLNDFGYDASSDEFYVEVEAENELTRVTISEEAYWNAVDN